MMYGPGGRQVEAQGLRRVYITNGASQPSQHALLWQACTKVRDAIVLGCLQRLLCIALPHACYCAQLVACGAIVSASHKQAYRVP